MADTAVIVPVLGRPRNAAPFMESLRTSDADATVYAVADEDDEDTIEAWTVAGAETILRPDTSHRGGTFAEKANVGYAQTVEPWLFLVGDDVKFHPGWLALAQHAAHTTGAQVVGVNDLGNPRTLTGEHAAHLLVSRQYVDEQGASWDGPGVVCHEGYRHWFVDDEIVTVAKQRGVWAITLDAVVEHMHPLFGKSAYDAVYKLGQMSAHWDREVYGRRLADHALAGV